MKHAVLRAIAHNFFASLLSGIGMATGSDLGVRFRDAVLGTGAPIEIDVLDGTVSSGARCRDLAIHLDAVRAALTEFCRANGAHVTNFRRLSAVLHLQLPGRRVLLTVEGHDRRRSTTEYVGVPLRRAQMLDEFGRRRPKPSLVRLPPDRGRPTGSEHED